MSDLQNPIFKNEDKAREHLEALRWPEGPICPHCGVVDRATKLEGKSTRPGVYKCRECRKPFSVTVGTVFERSKIKLTKWLLAVHLMASSKKGISSHQLHRMLGVTYKSAWFMTHRIREAMREGTFSTPMGGTGSYVEVDETYIGRQEGQKKRMGHGHKNPVLTLVQRGGRARSFHISGATLYNVLPIVHNNIALESTVMTDEAPMYKHLKVDYARHDTVCHSKDEYVRGDAYTNTVEGYFSIFKRGMKGVYQHCSEKHLHRYLAEFDFRYNNRTALGVDDAVRAETALKGITGKRLTYRRISQIQERVS